MSTHPRRCLALAAILGALLTLGAVNPAGAAKRPSFLLTGGDRWFTHDVGYPVVLGPAEIQLNGKRTVVGDLAANIHPDDHVMPVPGECETGIAFVYVEGKRRAADTTVSSAGEICGHHVQAPDSLVTHTFTGQATIEESGRRRFEGKTGFLEIRLAENGRAHVFATTS